MIVVAPYTAELGGITHGAAVDATGRLFCLHEVDGWDSPASTGSVEQRVGAHGGWPTRAYLAPRLATIKGTVEVPRGTSLEATIDDLLASIPLDVGAPLTVTRDGGVSRACFVRQDGEPEVSIISEVAAHYAIPLIAKDPLRYSAVESSATVRLPVVTGGLTLPTTLPFTIDASSESGTFNARNDGNFPTPFVVTVYGPADNPAIINSATGDRVGYAGAIEAGHFVVIDLAARTVMYDGQASRRGLLSGRFFDLAPGDNTLSFSAGFYSADAYAVISWRSAWK